MKRMHQSDYGYWVAAWTFNHHTYRLASNKRIAREPWGTTTNRIVIYYRAFGIDSTGTRTRISTLLVRTSLVLWAFRVNYTFGVTCWWTSNVALYTGANSLTINLSTLAVRSTWGRVAWILRLVLLNGSTCNKRVSFRAWRACAHWDMIDDFTDSILCTSPWTGINTFIAEASPIAQTVRVQYAFRTTTGVRISVIFWQTCADTIVTLSIRTTRRRIAWVSRNGFLF